ncbi:hypothetical protein [Burkholderia cenocepacia]|uniref:hypothetical protein n=1 Tax=Burkholderia cenocepacia TaxID=95486 RepID=UPI00406C1D0B
MSEAGTVCPDRLGGYIAYDEADLEEEHAVREAHNELEMLLDGHNRVAALIQALHGGLDEADEDWRESFAGFIEDQDARTGPQDATDPEHLLPAATELASVLSLAPPLFGEPFLHFVCFYPALSYLRLQNKLYALGSG